MEEKYNAFIIGRIRRWWDKKTINEQKEFVMDVANAGMAVILIAGTAALTKTTMDRIYRMREMESLKDMARFTRGDLVFKANSEENRSEIMVYVSDPESGDKKIIGRLSGTIDDFNVTAKAFSDSMAYINERKAANQYAKVICGPDGVVKKFHKDILN